MINKRIKITKTQQSIILEGSCPLCGKTTKLTLTHSQFDVIKNCNLINSNTVPFLTATQREFLISGICDYCWDELFKE